MGDAYLANPADVAMAIAQCEACASLAEYTGATVRFVSMLTAPAVRESVAHGNHLTALAEWAQGRGQETAVAVLEYLVGRGRSQAPAYAEAVRIAYGHAAAGWNGRERAAAVAGALRREGGYRAPRGSPAAFVRAITAAVADSRPPPDGPPVSAERPPDTDARPAWAALAARCAAAPAHGIPFDLAGAILDALQAATSSPECLGPNAEAARAMFHCLAGVGDGDAGYGGFGVDGLADVGGGGADAADCETARLFTAFVEHGEIELVCMYAERYGVPSEDARREAIDLVEAWADSHRPDERPDEADELVAVLRDAPVHETEAPLHALSYSD